LFHESLHPVIVLIDPFLQYLLHLWEISSDSLEFSLSQLGKSSVLP
jgi:hypothetical protein